MVRGVGGVIGLAVPRGALASGQWASEKASSWVHEGPGSAPLASYFQELPAVKRGRGAVSVSGGKF